MTSDHSHLRILFVAGGTLGPVVPLLAIAQELRTQDANVRLAWIGTRQGPEGQMVAEHRIVYKGIYAGKFRRYFSIKNLSDPILVFIGFLQAQGYLRKFRPHAVVHSGSFVGVPVVWAAWFLRIPVVVLQLDIKPSLANTLVVSFATRIGVAGTYEQKYFPQKKTKVVGIPVLSEVRVLREKQHDHHFLSALRHQYDIPRSLPVILMLGGGTGAAALNTSIWDALPVLSRHAYVIHITGTGKESPTVTDPHYRQYPFLTTELPALYALADLVVARAGMGTISWCAELGKPLVLIPIPDSHQEYNASFFERKGAVRYLSQKRLRETYFSDEILKLLSRADERTKLATALQEVFPAGAHTRMCALVHEAISV